MKIDLQSHLGSNQLYAVSELCCKIIHSMQSTGQVYLHTKEGKNNKNNGLYALLDQLCEYWKWDKSKITIVNPDPLAQHDQYNIKFSGFNHAVFKLNIACKIYPWNKEKYYGLFIGRATSCRIRAIHNHRNSVFSNHGLTSFNTNLFDFMDLPELVDYFCHSNQTYTEMLKIKPYSDISDIICTPPIGKTITPPYNFTNWGKVYEKIAIEIVCETSVESGGVDLSEKIFRPIYYKRPFLLIGQPDILQKLQRFGFKTFDGIIDETYDQYGGFTRVDAVFDILNNLIIENKMDTLLEQCHDILEHNHTVLTKWVLDERKVKWDNDNNVKE